MRIQKPQKHVKHHHVFIMVFGVVAIFFAGNVFAIDTIHKQITDTTLAEGTTPVILARTEKERAGDTIKSTPESKLMPLATTIQNVTKKYTTDFSVSVQNMNTGEYIGVNDSYLFKSASLYKLFVGLEVLRRVDDGTIKLDDAHGDGTIKDCIEVMIKVSDNTCGRSLRSLISSDIEQTQSIIDMGFTDTTISGNYPTTSARDVAKLYDDLYNQRLLKANTNTFFLDTLKEQEINNRIPVGLPAEMVIAHKTGDLEGYSHDAGIIYTDSGDWGITILSGPWPNGYSDAPAAFIELSAEIYNWIQLKN